MNVRYGVFLRPDPATCWTVTQITTALRRQFGLVSAGAYPPHVTLVGNLATNASAEQLVAALEPVFRATSPFTVFNSGVQQQGDGFEYGVNRDAQGQQPNQMLSRVATAVIGAMLPFSEVVDDFATVQIEQYRFAGHIGLASHDLKVDDHLVDEVGEYIAELPFRPPGAFDARWYSLIEFHADDWSGHWWQSLSWRHIRSWRIG